MVVATLPSPRLLPAPKRKRQSNLQRSSSPATAGPEIQTWQAIIATEQPPAPNSAPLAFAFDNATPATYASSPPASSSPVATPATPVDWALPSSPAPDAPPVAGPSTAPELTIEMFDPSQAAPKARTTKKKRVKTGESAEPGEKKATNGFILFRSSHITGHTISYGLVASPNDQTRVLSFIWNMVDDGFRARWLAGIARRPGSSMPLWPDEPVHIAPDAFYSAVADAKRRFEAKRPRDAGRALPREAACVDWVRLAHVAKFLLEGLRGPALERRMALFDQTHVPPTRETRFGDVLTPESAVAQSWAPQPVKDEESAMPPPAAPESDPALVPAADPVVKVEADTSFLCRRRSSSVPAIIAAGNFSGFFAATGDDYKPRAKRARLASGRGSDDAPRSAPTQPVALPDEPDFFALDEHSLSQPLPDVNPSFGFENFSFGQPPLEQSFLDTPIAPHARTPIDTAALAYASMPPLVDRPPTPATPHAFPRHAPLHAPPPLRIDTGLAPMSAADVAAIVGARASPLSPSFEFSPAFSPADAASPDAGATFAPDFAHALGLGGGLSFAHAGATLGTMPAPARPSALLGLHMPVYAPRASAGTLMHIAEWAAEQGDGPSPGDTPPPSATTAGSSAGSMPGTPVDASPQLAAAQPSTPYSAAYDPAAFAAALQLDARYPTPAPAYDPAMAFPAPPHYSMPAPVYPSAEASQQSFDYPHLLYAADPLPQASAHYDYTDLAPAPSAAHPPPTSPAAFDSQPAYDFGYGYAMPAFDSPKPFAAPMSPPPPPSASYHHDAYTPFVGYTPS